MKPHDVPIKSHLDPDALGVCGYCGQEFSPDEIVIEKTIHGRKWNFCSEDCYREFMDASNFADEPEQEMKPDEHDAKPGEHETKLS